MSVRNPRLGARLSLGVALLCVCVCGLPGCATVSSDGGFDAVARASREHLGQEVRWTRTPEERAKRDREVAALLERPLSVDDAVQIALLNNGALQASFDDLGLSEADLIASATLPNPGFTFRHARAGGEYDIEETLSVNVLSLLTMPFAHEIERRRFEAAQLAAVAQVVQLAHRAREAYFTALAARESAEYRLEVKSAAETGAELARRMQGAGNWSRADAAREQGFYLEAALQSTRAELEETVARASLTQLLGVSGEDVRLNLAQALPEVPPQAEALPGSADALLATRVDLKLMRMRMDALARNLHLTRATRFINVLEAGPARIRQGADAQAFETGYEVSLEVPIFDGGRVRVRKAETLYAQAVERFTQAAVDARAEVRKAYAAYRAAHEIAVRERDELLPLRKSIAAENLKRYDAAQLSVFDLLADSRAEIAGVDEYIQSARDFWIAKSTLDAALLGNP